VRSNANQTATAGDFVASIDRCQQSDCLPSLELWLLDPGTGARRRIACGPRPCDWEAPAYLAATRQVAFNADSGVGIADQAFRRVRLVSLPQGLSSWDMSWSPDGSRLLVVTRRGLSQTGVLYMMDVKTGRLTLWGSGVDAAWSARGRIVVQDSKFGFHITGQSGRRPRVLSNISGIEPTFSPDGQSLAYVCRQGTFVCVTNVEHPRERRIGKRCFPTGEPGRQIAWSPDGASVICASSSSTEIVDVRTGHAKFLPRFGGTLSDAGYTASLAWEAR
jgi:Tol biopolymer transport system component